MPVCVASSDLERSGNPPKGEVLLQRLREYVQEQGELTCLTTGCQMYFA